MEGNGMMLKRVAMNGFRSVERAVLEDCGTFNVLIGKNNAGKSNALSAIASFFEGIAEGRVVSEEPAIGSEIDFFDKNVEKPIQIVMTFSLTLAERDVLIRDIVSEAPQVRHAIDGISPTLDMTITWMVTSRPKRFGYVSRIEITAAGSGDASAGESEQPIFVVTNEAAIELFEHASRSSRVTAELTALDRVARDLPEQWRHFTRESTTDRLPMRYFLDAVLRSERLNPTRTPELYSSIEKIFEESSNQDDVSVSLDSHRACCGLGLLAPWKRKPARPTRPT